MSANAYVTPPRPTPLTVFAKGERLVLPSHKLIELLKPTSTGVLRWECGYVVNGKVLPEGHEFRNRLTVREDWLRKHGRPAR